MLEAAQAAAAANNAKLDVFDGNLDPGTQVKLLQDAVASGKYDGVILQPVYGAGLVEGAKAAIAADVAIGNIDQILGADNTTADLQVAGQLSNVVFVPSELGRKIGEMVVSACADTNPCNVGYIWSVKAAALDQTLKQAFDKATSVNPNIKVVAEGESFYTTPNGLKAAQDMLTAHPEINVITGADQAITGALQAVKAANVADKVKLVGYGGGDVAFKGIKAGERFGTVMQAPATEGKLGHRAVHPGHPHRHAGRGRRRPRQPARRRRGHAGQRRQVPDARGVAGLTIAEERVMGRGRRPPRHPRGRQVVRRHQGARRRLDRDPRRLRSRLRRRERGRQVHARQDRGRGLPARSGRALAPRRAGRLPVAARGAAAGHRARRPGGGGRPPAHRRRERVPGQGAPPARLRAAAQAARAVRAPGRRHGPRRSPRTRSSGRSRWPSSSRSRSCGRWPATPS